MNQSNGGATAPSPNFVIVETDGPVPLDEHIRRNVHPEHQRPTGAQRIVLDRREDEDAGEMDMEDWQENVVVPIVQRWEESARKELLETRKELEELRGKAKWADYIENLLEKVRRRYGVAKTASEEDILRITDGGVKPGSLIDNFLKAAITSKQMVDLEVKERLPIIDDWFKEGDIGYIYSVRGLGKTWFSMEMSIAIAKGEPLGPWKNQTPRKVLYVDGEVSLHETQKRNRALEANTDNFIYLHHEHLYNLTGLTMDIADPEQQGTFLEFCKRLNAQVVVLDNLSCLAPKVDENDSFGFSNELLNFTLNMRRNGISLVFVQHAGRNGQMRGHSRREDPANWIIKLDEAKDSDTAIGAKFRTVFQKNRNAAITPTIYEWHFVPDGDKTLTTYKEMDPLSLFRAFIEDGITQNKELAEAMGLQPYQITRLANKAIKQGWLTKKGPHYTLCGVTVRPGPKSVKAAEEKAAAEEIHKDYSWIFEVPEENGSLCTTVDNNEKRETRVTCTASDEEVNGKYANEMKKSPLSTIGYCLTKLNKTCSCGGRHYVKEDE